MPNVDNGVNGQNGGLFQGIRLWISSRVPKRTECVELVRGNGGVVVRDEKTADMLIFDHEKKPGASPAYTWKWIETSVKNGVLEHKSDYLIRMEPRAKSTRTPFSPKDDLLVLKYVQNNEGQHHPKTADELFRDLARSHPHHTKESWYDRWNKVVKPRRRAHTPDGQLQRVAAESRPSPEQAANADIPASTAQSARQSQPNKEAQPSHGSPPSRHRAPKPSAPASRSRPAGGGRNAFTDEDVRMLMAHVRKQKALGKPLSGNKIYMDFAQHNPAHSWHSWRDKALKQLPLMEAVDDVGPDEQSDAAQDDSGGDEKPQPRLQIHAQASKLPSPSMANNPVASNGATKVLDTAGAPSPSPRPAASWQLNPKSDDERLKRREREKARIHAAKLLQRAWRGHAVRRQARQARLEAAVVPLQAMIRGYLVRLRERDKLARVMDINNASEQADGLSNAGSQDHAEEGPRGSATGPDGMLQHDRDARGQFYDDLEAYIEVSGAKVVGGPLVNGRPIDLWDLFSLATQQDCQPEKRNWEQVAGELGFDLAACPAVIKEVRECYHQNLAEFEETIRAYENDGGSEEDAEQEPEEPSCDQPLVDYSSPAYRSSPPFAASKRPRQHAELLISDPGYPSDGSRKRRRLNKDVVIPPTPEEKLDLARGRLDRGAAHDKSSPLKSRGAAEGEADEIGSGEEADDFSDAGMEDVEGVGELPERADPQKRKHIEPETQDWHFGMDNEQELRLSIEEDDISPSQQLQLETEDFQSPRHFVTRGQVTASQTANRPSPPALTPRAARETGIRALGPEPKFAGVKAPGAYVSRAPPANGKATKRLLPPQYQSKPDSATLTPVPVPRPTRNATAQPHPQPRLSNSMLPSRTSPVRPTNSSALRAKPSSTYAHTPVALPSSSRRAPTYPRSSPPNPLNGNSATGNRGPVETYDEAYFNAQVEHFQGLGYEEKHILKALFAANFQRGPMAVVVQSLKEGGKIPSNEAGIWTNNDDKALRLVMDYERRIEKGKDTADGRTKAWAARQGLISKHGEDGYQNRVEVMEAFEAGGSGQQT